VARPRPAGLALVLGALWGLAAPAAACAQAVEGPPAPAAQTTEGALPIPMEARASDHFDAAAATLAYLATVPAGDKARSDAYFEGGYWLLLWNFLVTSAIYLLLLAGRWSARMRSLAQRLTRVRILRAMAYWTQLTLVTSVLSLPLTLYQGYFREHHYGLATQTLGAWTEDQLKGLALTIVLGGLFVAVLYRVLRTAPHTWWLWGSAVTLAFLVVGALVAPVYVAPLFNKYTKLDDPVVRDPILSMARANGIPASDVYVVDASRQSTRVSANVSGFLGTERITLNDNLLNRATLPEIEAVMGHEMGHYVLNHVYKSLLFLGVLTVLVFALLKEAAAWALGRWGGRWDVKGVDDLAGLPLLALATGVIFFVLTPVTNSFTRVQEYEADIFGLNAARQPDGMALVSLKLGEYRKLDPGMLEELVFFDHPSGRTRIFAAMRWKAEHLGETPGP
jgi:Zn-dependent protease with chaperone function